MRTRISFDAGLIKFYANNNPTVIHNLSNLIINKDGIIQVFTILDDKLIKGVNTEAILC